MRKLSYMPPYFYIVERKDGRFEGRYPDDGKRRSVYAKSYEECYSKLLAAVDKRDHPEKYNTFLSWLRDFIVLYKKGAVSGEVYKAMERNIRLHIAPNVSAELEIGNVRPMHIQKILISVEHIRTRESVYQLIAGAMRQALAERLIEFNPMLAVPNVKAKRNKGTALSVDEQLSFLKALHGNKLEPYYLFCLYSGCRRNEAIFVRREDIDESAGIIHIRGTKTEHSDRFIPYFDTLKRVVAGLPQSGRLFPWNPDYVTKQFKRFSPGHVLHDLRHTFATRALEAGVPMKVVQVWLGHSEISTTMDIYSDVTRDLSLREAVKIDKVFNSQVFDT